MKKLSFLLFALLFIRLSGTETPLLKFKENKKQWPAEVRFMGEFPSGKVFLENTAFVYEVLDAKQLSSAIEKQGKKEDVDDLILNGHVYKTVFLNAQTTSVKGEEKQPEYYNYFLGKDQSKWSSHVNAYEKISYSNLYKGIDMNVYSSGSNFKYDLILAPVANATLLQLQIENVDAISLLNGELQLKTNAGIITEKAPEAWQLINGKKVNVECNYNLSNNIVSFVFPKGYNKKHVLTIDPIVVACTFSGSTVYNYASATTFDEYGNGISTGIIYSAGFPTTSGAFQSTFGGVSDALIHKFNPDGSALLFTTYLG